MPRTVTNKTLAVWVASSPQNRLSYMVNNNPNGVIAFLNHQGAMITDVNGDGTISTDELYAALREYAKAKYGSIQKFLDHAGDYIPHNDNAPRKWNLYL